MAHYEAEGLELTLESLAHGGQDFVTGKPRSARVLRIYTIEDGVDTKDALEQAVAVAETAGWVLVDEYDEPSPNRFLEKDIGGLTAVLTLRIFEDADRDRTLFHLVIDE